MKSTDIPTKFQIPFGNAAAAGTIRPIPVADQSAITPGAASLTTGFPTVTGQPLASGGIPPSMQDFNGLFFQATAWNRWQAAAGLSSYDAAFSTAIGGYPQGATILSATAPGRIWISTADNNTTNPDGGNAANWLPVMTSNDVVLPATASVTLQVNASTGNDATGNGSLAKPFATPAAAAIYGASRTSFAGYSLILQHADGTYPPPGVLPPLGGQLILQGNTSNPSAVAYAGNGPNVGGVGLVTASQSSSVTLNSITVQNNGSINHNVAGVSGGTLTLQNVTLQTSTQIPFALVYAGNSGNVVLLNGCTMGGGAAWMWYVLGNGTIQMGANVNVSGVAFSIATAAVNGPGMITYNVPTVSFNVTGTVTGKRYSVASNGAIIVGGNVNFFPGNQAGVTDGTGSYA